MKRLDQIVLATLAGLIAGVVLNELSTLQVGGLLVILGFLVFVGSVSERCRSGYWSVLDRYVACRRNPRTRLFLWSAIRPGPLAFVPYQHLRNLAHTSPNVTTKLTATFEAAQSCFALRSWRLYVSRRVPNETAEEMANTLLTISWPTLIVGYSYTQIGVEFPTTKVNLFVAHGIVFGSMLLWTGSALASRGRRRDVLLISATAVFSWSLWLLGSYESIEGRPGIQSINTGMAVTVVGLALFHLAGFVGTGFGASALSRVSKAVISVGAVLVGVAELANAAEMRSVSLLYAVAVGCIGLRVMLTGFRMGRSALRGGTDEAIAT